MILKPQDKMNYLGNGSRQKKKKKEIIQSGLEGTEMFREIYRNHRSTLSRKASEMGRESTKRSVLKATCPGLLFSKYSLPFPSQLQMECAFLPIDIRPGYVNFFGQQKC